MQCDALQAYLDRTLDAAASAQYEGHLEGCVACRQQVHRWQELQTDLEAWSTAQAPATPSSAQAERLVALTERRSRSRWRVSLLAGASLVGGLAAAAAVTLFIVRPQALRPSTRGSVADQPLSSLAVLVGRDETHVQASGAGAWHVDVHAPRALLALGPDRLGIAQHGQLDLTHAMHDAMRVRLEDGRLALAIDGTAGKRDVVVSTGEVSVRVVGTRFWVERDEALDVVDVGVWQGTVEVTGTRGTEVLRAGSGVRIERGLWKTYAVTEPQVEAAQAMLQVEAPRVEPAMIRDAVSPNAKVLRTNAVPLRQWQAWILAGRYAEAESALRRYLRRNPRDAEAWSMLADCLRKAGKTRAAVDAYRRLVDTGGPEAINRARYLAASLLQDQLDDPAAAIPLLRAYLAAGASLRPLEALATLRLARALRSTGDQQQAMRLLRRVCDEFPDTEAARQAHGLLDVRGEPSPTR